MSETVTETNRGTEPSDVGRDWRTIARALGVVLALWIAGPVVGNIVGSVPVIAVVLQEGGLPEQLPAWSLLTGQVIVDGTFLLVGAVYARRWLGGLDLSIPEGRDRRWVAVGLGGALAVWLGSVAVSRLLSVEGPASTITGSFEETWALVAFAVLGVAFIPLAEEVLFRGAIQRRLRRTVGRWPAIVLASLTFLSVHLLNFSGGSLLGLGLAFGTLFGVSVVIGYVYDRADSLGVPVAVHVGYNAVVFGVLLAGTLA